MASGPPVGALLGLASAFLFGASTPLAKILVGEIDPWLLASLLYLGSGFGLGCVVLVGRFAGRRNTEAPLRRADLPWLGAAILAGGVIGPVLMMIGIAQTPASTAALLLNLEGIATMAIAWVVFREHTDRRILLGAAAILTGAVILSWNGGQGGLTLGALAIGGACLAWGIDNNLTRKVSGADPVQIAMLKGLVAGSVNLALALSRGAEPPPLGIAAAAGVVGFLGYGVSLVLFVLALRAVGTSRASAYFSAAPFVGALLGVAVLADAVTWRLAAAAALMAVGLYLHLVEHHEHEHTHEPLDHEHAHFHDEHHQHDHRGDDPRGEPHTHPHRHGALTHRHRHFPDLHHRHTHG